MQSAEIITPQSLLEFEGLNLRASCAAPTVSARLDDLA